MESHEKLPQNQELHKRSITMANVHSKQNDNTCKQNKAGYENDGLLMNGLCRPQQVEFILFFVLVLVFLFNFQCIQIAKMILCSLLIYTFSQRKIYKQ